MTNVENEIANISASETVIAPLLSTYWSEPTTFEPKTIII